MAQRGFGAIILLFGFIAVILIIGLFYLFNPFGFNQKSKITSNIETKFGMVEMAKRTLYKGDQPAEILEEKSTRNLDGSLETIVTSGNMKLSHHLYTDNFILDFSNGVLNLQGFKSGTENAANYLTTGENILLFVSQDSSLQKTTETLNGKKINIYTIGGSKKTSFEFIKKASAQEEEASVLKVYVDDTTGVLQKIEQIPVGSVQPEEVIEYTEGPSLPPLPITDLPTETPTPQASLAPIPLGDQIAPTLTPEDVVNQLPNLTLEDQLKLIEEQFKKDRAYTGTLPDGSKSPSLTFIEEVRLETKEVKATSIEPAVVPSEGIQLNPLSIIPTPSGYNSPIMLLSSTVFNQQSKMYKTIDTTIPFDIGQFTKDNVKIRIDGVEVSNASTNLEPARSSSSTDPWTVSLLIPKGLSPGYHTIEVFMVDSWFLAPNILVTLPRPDEKVLELELFIDPPPLAVKLPDDKGYRVTLKGNNLIKPFTVSIGSTVLDDSAVEVNGSGELILTIPPNLPDGPIYSITITKGSQKAFRPSLLILGSSSPPN